MLKFKDVSFSYDLESPLIEDLNFEINRGDFVGLIGQSGCGKSTVFRLILNFEKPSSGEIILDPPSTKIGFMPQKDMLFPWRTIEKNLALPLEVQKLPPDEIGEKVNSILEDMELIHTRDLYPSELSGGMRQRIAFARTVLTGADLLLLDEPFSALDYFTRMDFQDWILNQYQRLDKTIFFITHSVEEAILLSNRILMFEDKPVRKLNEIGVDLEYPRTQSMLNRSEIIDMKTSLIERLKKGQKGGQNG